MRFIISRTSSYSDKPCDEAVKVKLTRYHWSSCKTLEETKANHGCKMWFWRERMRNQREENGRTVCESDCEDWVVDVESPMEIVDKYGAVVIDKSDYKEIPYKIEIYDDYRE